MQTHKILQRPPIANRLSVPMHSRTVLASTRTWGQPLLFAHQCLIDAIKVRGGAKQCRSEYLEKYSFITFRDASKINDDTAIALFSAAVILNWMVGNALGEIKAHHSLSDAEYWFKGGKCKETLLNELDGSTQSAILSPLRKLNFGHHFIDILPYAAEVFETSDEILKAFGQSRKSKKAAGIFYTPSDVSDHIVDYAFSIWKTSHPFSNRNTWLDPATGTGCFLLSALYRGAQTLLLSPGKEALFYIARCLFGIDKSPIALQSAAYALVLAAMQKKWLVDISLQESLFLIGKNLYVHDATKIKTLQDLSILIPSLPSGADFVISNPPYVKQKTCNNSLQADIFSEMSLNRSSSKNLYIDFVKMLTNFTNSNSGVGGMVVPLSITYNTHQEFRNLRRFMTNTEGKWWLANFDRTPDSLFGDDVKTRNSIVFFARESGQNRAIYTSDLIRWNSRTRQELFKHITFSKIPMPPLKNIIPKCGNDFGQELLHLFEKRNTRLGDSIAKVSLPFEEQKRLLRHSKTAYNWLPFEIISPLSDNGKAITESKYSYWAAISSEDVPIIFSLVQSRIAYWLWRVWGDGFHFTDDFVISLPLSPNNLSKTTLCDLKRLGLDLWVKMQNHIVISKNAGVVSYSYCPYAGEKIIDQIDYLISVEYGLPCSTTSYLKDIMHNTIVAGRENEVNSSPALSRWRLKEKEYENCFAEN